MKAAGQARRRAGIDTFLADLEHLASCDALSGREATLSRLAILSRRAALGALASLYLARRAERPAGLGHARWRGVRRRSRAHNTGLPCHGAGDAATARIQRAVSTKRTLFIVTANHEPRAVLILLPHQSRTARS